MTDRDLDWGALSALWNAGGPAPADRVAELKRVVHRQHRRLRLVVAAEIGLTVVMMGLLMLVWVRAPGPRTTTLGTFALVHSAVVWALVLWNRRGHWSLPETGTVRDTLVARRAHLQRRHRTLIAMRRLCVAELVTLPFLFWALERGYPAGTARTLVSGAVAIAVLGAVVAWAGWEGRRIGRWQSELDALARELDEEV